MLQNAADIINSGLADACIAVAGKYRLAVFPYALMSVHSGTVVPEYRLRHEGYCLAVPFCNILDYIFKEHQVVCHLDQRLKPHVDFSLSCCGDLVVFLFDIDAAVLHLKYHLCSYVLLTVCRRHREISLFVPWLVAEVMFLVAA